MKYINIWGICTFVFPILMAISIGFIVIISSLLKGIFKFLGGAR